MSKDKLKVVSLDNNDIRNKIYIIRDLPIILDSDLASLYNVNTKSFNQAVKRNVNRFPKEFRFQLTTNDYNNLRSQFVTSRFRLYSHGGRRYLPYVFTEQGVAMLSGILNSKIAIKINIQIMKAFISMRKFLFSNISISNRLEYIEQKTIEYESNFKKIFTIIDSKENKLKD